MRFVFVSAMSGCPWGGSEELWSRAASRLHQTGHQVSASVVWWPQMHPRVRALIDQGIEFYIEKPRLETSLAVRAFGKVRRSFGGASNELAWLRRQNPELVIISQGSNADGLPWMNTCRAAGVPFTAIVQANFETWWPDDKRAGDLARAYRAAKRVWCVSRRNLDLLEFQIGEALPNAGVVWNPLNVPADQPPAWPAENGVWKLACVARLEPAAKGQDILFQVLSQPQWRGRPWELNLYGSGPCEQNLKKLANRFEFKNVRFHGQVAEVRKIWEENHLLVLPSRFEGLPLALVEAMWCGRPAVVTDIGGNAEICVDGETGFVAGAPAFRLLEHTMESAWNRRGDWQNMGKAARLRVEKTVPNDPIEDFCQLLLKRSGFQDLPPFDR
jgi:glycosyltransferase involved in cell wall biosynthesis